MTERKLSRKLAALSLSSMLALSAGLGTSLHAMGNKKNIGNKGAVNSQEDMSSSQGSMGTASGRKTGESSMSGGWEAWSEKAWRSKLNLTSEQQEKWRKAEQDRLEAVQPAMARHQDNFQRLNQQLKANAAEEDLRSTLDQIDADRKKIQSEQEHYADQIRNILTPKQQAQMVASMEQNMRGGAGRMMKGTRRQGNMGGTGSTQEKNSSESSESSETQEKSNY